VLCVLYHLHPPFNSTCLLGVGSYFQSLAVLSGFYIVLNEVISFHVEFILSAIWCEFNKSLFPNHGTNSTNQFFFQPGHEFNKSVFFQSWYKFNKSVFTNHGMNSTVTVFQSWYEFSISVFKPWYKLNKSTFFFQNQGTNSTNLCFPTMVRIQQIGIFHLVSCLWTPQKMHEQSSKVYLVFLDQNKFVLGLF
jgi:hypothetical protein